MTTKTSIPTLIRCQGGYTEKNQPQSDAIKQSDIVELRQETNWRSSTQHYQASGKDKTNIRIELPARPNPPYVTNAHGKVKGKGGATSTHGRGFGRGGGKGSRPENKVPWGERSDGKDSDDESSGEFHNDEGCDGRAEETDPEDDLDEPSPLGSP